jgi:hypothetical protein
MPMHHRAAPVAASVRTRGGRTITCLVVAGAMITAASTAGLVFRRGPCTLTGTTTVQGATVSVCARYSVSAAGRVQIHSVRAIFNAQAGYWAPRFTVILTQGGSGILDDRLSGRADDARLVPSSTSQFAVMRLVPSYRSQFTALRGPGANGSFALGEDMVVALTVKVWGANRPYKVPLASVPLVLRRPAIPGPNPALAGSGDFSRSGVNRTGPPTRRRTRSRRVGRLQSRRNF